MYVSEQWLQTKPDPVPVPISLYTTHALPNLHANLIPKPSGGEALVKWEFSEFPSNQNMGQILLYARAWLLMGAERVVFSYPCSMLYPYGLHLYSFLWKYRVRFQDHPQAAQLKVIRMTIHCLTWGIEFSRPPRTCGHDAPIGFKNYNSNLVQIRLLYRKALRAKRVESKNVKLKLIWQRRLNFKISSLSKQERQLPFHPVWKS